MSNPNVPSSNINTNSTNVTFYYNGSATAASQEAFLEAEKKNEGAERQALLSLSAILNSVAQTLSEGSSGGESTAPSSSNPNSASGLTVHKKMQSGVPNNQKSGGPSFEQMAICEGIINNINQLQKTLTENSQTNTTNKPQSQNTEESIIDALSAMTMAMGKLESNISEAASKKATSDVAVSQAFAQAAHDAMVKAQQEMAQIAAEKSHEHKIGILEKILSVVVTAVVDTVACCFGQVEIAAIATTMCVLQVSGAMSDMTKAISGAIATDLEKNAGVPKAQAEKDADAIADAIVLVMVVVCTAGVGAASGVSTSVTSIAETTTEDAVEAGIEASEEAIEATAGAATNVVSTASTDIGSAATTAAKKAAKTVVEQGIEMAEATGESTVEDASTNITESITEAAETNEKSIGSKAYEMFQKAYKNTLGKLYENNPLRNVSALGNLTITAAIQGTMSTGVVGSATAASLSKEGASDAEIARATAIANLVTGIVCMVGMSFSVDGLSSSLTDSKNSYAFMRKVNENVKKAFSQFPQLINTLQNIKFTAETAQVTATAVNGASQIELGLHQQILGDVEADFELTREYSSATNSLMENDQKAYTGLLKGHEEIDQTVMQEMLSYQATYTQLLSQSA